MTRTMRTLVSYFRSVPPQLIAIDVRSFRLDSLAEHLAMRSDATPTRCPSNYF